MRRKNISRWLPVVITLAAGLCNSPDSAAELVQVIDVEKVWSGHPVGFSLLTSPPHQFVAYYDAERQMTVAQRELGRTDWTFTKLPEHIGWDSHNYVTMTLDREGHLHLAGNMHCVPLIYFRSKDVGDASSLTRVMNMVGPEREQRVTYPVFLHGPENRLIFRYRDGRSGSGDDIYNGYDESTGQWQRLIDKPLTSGQGKMNAYCSRPYLGPDDRYHITWVWRDTSDCATNHDLSYARSPDLLQWESADGQPLELPITITSGAVVDPVPAHGGIINGGHRLGFDSRNRPVIVYHKYDSTGNTQIYVARYEQSEWKVRQVSDWKDYRWEFQGGGSIPFEVRIGGVQRLKDALQISCTYGRGRASWMLDDATLQPVDRPSAESGGKRTAKAMAPKPIKVAGALAAAVPGLNVRHAGDVGAGHQFDYRIRWQAAGSNRDRPRPGPIPPPVMLQVLKYAR